MYVCVCVSYKKQVNNCLSTSKLIKGIHVKS